MRQRNKRTGGLGLLLALIAAVSLIAAACSGSSESADEPAELTSITLGGGAYMQTAQATLALVHGLFEANGLAVDVAEFATGRDAMTALLGGQVDLAFMAEFPAVTAALQGEEFSVIAEVSR
ncbi:MAG: hypothetical protein F4Y13_00805, partial [Acidimicrobiaceae bacterium]|nr:hypothetical protein [Acidimicrobiaceae bacterium]